MENYDEEQELRVWQRIRGELPPENLEGLQALAAAEWAEASGYLMLSRQFQGKEKEMLRRMFEEDRAHASCLRGIDAITSGKNRVPRTTPPAPDSPRIALKKCYGREIRALREYELRTTDPEYGHVFASLAAQEQEHCRMILEILGNLK